MKYIIADSEVFYSKLYMTINDNNININKNILNESYNEICNIYNKFCEILNEEINNFDKDEYYLENIDISHRNCIILDLLPSLNKLLNSKISYDIINKIIEI